ncbi:MAG: BtrH N-terminal domain-containing protein [Deltaproteobacteria bacterium]|nr:BtrH N-terminal domain-containing protein [Deltaproteobacteria bacterium]
MKAIDGYEHKVASHCETGTLRNLVSFAGMDISEPMVFGIGSGPMFIYLFFAKGPSTLPLIGLRNRPANIFKFVGKLCGIDFRYEKFKNPGAALSRANEWIDRGVPVGVSVDMFYMKYLPIFLRVHAPSHFIVLVGRDDGAYMVSDPYNSELGRLDREDLEAAMDTHAPLARDNFLITVRGIPDGVDWKHAAKKAMKKTVKVMLMPPGIRRLVPFMGIQGMKLYARKVRQWPDRYQGVVLREGILFNAVGFEDQGTGGGAFRLMYGAFLQEAAGLFGSTELEGLAERMIEHGQDWRRLSRKLIEIGKQVPLNDDEYPRWLETHGEGMRSALHEVSERFLEKAAFEERFFKDLDKVVARLG